MILARCVMVVAVVSGCVGSSSIECGDGTFCPADTTCDVTRNRCVTNEQTAACAVLSEGGECTVLGAPGTCRTGACELWLCGDGVRSVNEVCDGDDLGDATCASLGFATTTTGLACNALCRYDTGGCSGTCGDGVLDPGEDCDLAELAEATCTSEGFYDDGAVTCSANCSINTSTCTGFCGDDVVNGPELCDGAPPREACIDLGYDAGPSACGAGCAPSFATCARLRWRLEVVTTLARTSSITYAPDGDAWVVGDDGFAARNHGGVWQTTATGTAHSLVGVEASSTRVFAYGSLPSAPDVLLEWRGSSWQSVPVPAGMRITAIAAIGELAVVATDGNGVQVWNGSAWATVGTVAGTLRTVGGTSMTDLWVGSYAGLAHWNGSAWTTVLTNAFEKIIVTSTSNVIAAGRDGASFGTPPLLAHWDGAVWTTYRPPSIGNVHGDSIRNLWITLQGTTFAAYHFDGAHFAESSRIDTIGVMDMAVLGTREVIALTNAGVVYRSRGQDSSSNVANAVTSSTAMWSDGGRTAFIANTTGRVFLSTGAAWAPTVVSPGSLDALFGFSASDVYVGGALGILYHWNGGSWSEVKTGLGAIKSIWGTSGSDLWIFGDAGASHFDGTAWQLRTPGAPVVLGTGSSSTDVWAASATQVFHWTGTAWSVARTLAATSIYARTATDVYIASKAHHLDRFDGTAWTKIDVPSINTVAKVAAFAPDDVFALTTPDTGQNVDGAELVHFDGQRWAPVRIDPPTSSAGSYRLASFLARPHRLEIHWSANTLVQLDRIMRVRPWVCRATETSCSDGVDDDCDDKVDADDSDCP